MREAFCSFLISVNSNNFTLNYFIDATTMNAHQKKIRTSCVALSERPQAFRLFCQGASGAHCRNPRPAQTMSASACLSFITRQRWARNLPFALTHHGNRSGCGPKRNVSAAMASRQSSTDETSGRDPASAPRALYRNRRRCDAQSRFLLKELVALLS